jgi:D-serine deaminase-like pyridoxal phosphate-dependent protein
VTSSIANRDKAARLVSLSRWADVTITVDSLDVARAISNMAIDAGIGAKAAVEMSTIRCGLQAGDPTVRFVKELALLGGLEVKGVWTHEAGRSDESELGMEPNWGRG